MNRALAVAQREVRRILAMPPLWLLLLPIPLAMTLILVGVFRGEVVRDLPVAVLDLDRSTTSRVATRWLESTRGGSVAVHVEDLGEARSVVLSRRAYAVMVIPRHFERDLARGRRPHVTLLYNEQNITAGNNLSSDAARAVSTAASTIVASRGHEPAPIRVDLHVLFNPGANYGRAFLIPFIGGLLQVVIGLSTVYAVGRELLDRTAGEWLSVAGGSTLSAWGGKLLPYTIFHSVMVVVLAAIYVVSYRVPVQGTAPRLVLGIVAFVVASQALALLLVAGTASLGKGLTLASLIFGPAVAFCGVTFPLQAMTTFGYTWAQAIPLTHAMELARAGISVGDKAPISGPLLALATDHCGRDGAVLQAVAPPASGAGVLGAGMKALFRCTIATLHQIRSNKETLGVLVGATVIYGFFYPSPYLREVLRDVPVIVVDRDHTPMSRQFARWLDASEGVAVSGHTEDLETARDVVRAADAGGIVLIPEDFERHILRREPAYLTAYADANYLLVYSTVSKSVSAVAATMGATVSRSRPPVSLASWPLFNPVGGYATFLVPGVLILVLQQTLLIGVGALRVAERNAGAGDSEPIWAILGGKVTALVLVYLLHAAFLFLVAFRIYGLPFRGALLPTAAFLVPFVASATLLGLSIGELFRRSEAPMMVYTLTAIPAVMLSGISFPVDVQAGWVRAFAATLPSTFGIQGFLQIGEMGATLGEASHAWIALWTQVLVYGGIAAALMYRRRARLQVAAAA